MIELGNVLALRSAELETSSRELKRAQTVAKVGSWVYDLPSDTMRLSAETCRIFGVPEGAVGSHDSYLSAVHAEDRSVLEAAWQAALSGAAFAHAHRIVVRGATCWVFQSAELEYSPDGIALQAFGIVQDITERKLAEAALQESENRYRGLLEWTPEAVAVHRDGLVVYVNPAAAAMLGATSPGDMIGRRVLDSVHPDYRDSVLARIRQVSELGTSTPLIEEKFIRLDGTPIDVEVQTTPIVFDGKPSVHVAMRDISARKHAEQALRASEEKFAKAFQSSPLFVSIATRDSGRYIDVNEAFLRVSGYTRQEVIGKTSAEIGLWKNPGDRQRAIEALRQQQSVKGLEAELYKKSGESVLCEIWGDPIEVDGIPCVIWVTSDITERKAAEAARASLQGQLRESQKMEAIGTLAGGIAHDFNNIIATILGNTDLARQDAGTNAAVLESLEEIRKSGTRARDLVQQILSFSRREPTQRKPLHLTPVVEAAARLLRATLPARVALRVDCDASLPAVLADKTQIEQVLINLANNAVQAMHDTPGHIDIRLDSVVLDAQTVLDHPELHALHLGTPGRTVRLAVSDDGPGMQAETLARIFEPFFTTKPVGEGTGLGLSVVHGIVQAHEGAIVVASQPGKGTTFTLYLPIAAPMPGVPAPGVPQRGGRHVLYLDDDVALVSLVKRLLERRGICVSAHSSQRAALDALRADPAAFDLLLTDYNMPEMSGLDVAREARSIRADLPIAIASGFIDEALRAQAAAAGVHQLIFKASAVEDFCATIEGLLPAPG